jgi:hypothetical protein
MKQIATVVNNNQPGWQNIVETEPDVTLPIGTKLYLAEPFAAIGAQMGGGFFAGEYTLNGERYALVVAPKAEGEKLDVQYKKHNTADGADSDDDGLANSEGINDAKHPAAQFCRSLQIGGNNDWYLPSRDEQAMLQRNLGPRRKNTPEQFREGSAEAFQPNWYWSSTENASYSGYAWVVVFSNGNQNYLNKANNFGVRAVRRLKL